MRDYFHLYMPSSLVAFQNRAIGPVYVPVNGYLQRLGVDKEPQHQPLKAGAAFDEALLFEEDPLQFDVWLGNPLDLYHYEFEFDLDDYLTRLKRLMQQPHKLAVEALGYGYQSDYAKAVAPYKRAYDALSDGRFQYYSPPPFHEVVPYKKDLEAFGKKIEAEEARLVEQLRQNRAEEEEAIKRKREQLIAAFEAILPAVIASDEVTRWFRLEVEALLKALRAGRWNEMVRRSARELKKIWGDREPGLVFPDQAEMLRKVRGRPPLPASAKIRKPPGEPKLKPHIQARA